MSFEQKTGFSLFTIQSDTERVNYLRRTLLSIIILLVLVLTNNIVFNQAQWVYELIFCAVFFGFLYYFCAPDTVNIVAAVALWTVTILASYFGWMNDGLYDTSIVIFPCILIFSSFLGGVVLTVSLVIYMLATLYFFAYAMSEGMMLGDLQMDSSPWGKANNLALILVLYGVSIAIIVRFVRVILRRLWLESTRSEKIKARAQKLVEYDLLTRLPNETLCKQQFEKYMHDSLLVDQLVAVITLDLNNFKVINSSMGHEIGDKVICELAMRFEDLSFAQAEAFRNTGSEFVFLLQSEDYDSAIEFCQRLLQLIGEPIQILEYEVELSGSLGVAFAPFDGTSYHVLRQKSHTALSHAKEDHDAGFKIYESEMDAFIRDRLRLIKELKIAIEQEQFQLWYQPKVELSSGKILGAESLIRWVKADGKVISPFHFISVAEESGLIADIGNWVITQSIADCSRWHQMGFEISVAINLSPGQFRRGDIVSTVSKALNYAELAPEYVELEITESLFVEDDNSTKDQLDMLVNRGMSIAIDDFGTGYSNLNYLNKFNASTLKIDMSFIRNMTNDKRQQHIVDAIVQMSKAMGLKNVAEGVEDEATSTLLQSLGCEVAQGYFWSKPVPFEEFVHFLKQ